ELRALKAHVFERGDPALGVLEQGLRILRTTDLRSDLAALAVPSLWLGGRRDRLGPPAAMRWSAQASPAGEFVEIASGHAPFLSHATQVAGLIGAFAHRIAP